MPTYIIERDVPGASRLSPDDLRAMSQRSCEVLRELGPDYRWLHTYVAGDKLYCVHDAPSAELVREHACRGGFPVSRVTQVAATIGPHTAEAGA